MIKKYVEFKNESMSNLDIEDKIQTQTQEEEEEGGDFYSNKLNELANKLGVEVSNGEIKYKGKTIIFPSETNQYHVDRNKFQTSDEVVEYLNGVKESFKKK